MRGECGRSWSASWQPGELGSWRQQRQHRVAPLPCWTGLPAMGRWQRRGRCRHQRPHRTLLICPGKELLVQGCWWQRRRAAGQHHVLIQHPLWNQYTSLSSLVGVGCRSNQAHYQASWHRLGQGQSLHASHMKRRSGQGCDGGRGRWLLLRVAGFWGCLLALHISICALGREHCFCTLAFTCVWEFCVSLRLSINNPTALPFKPNLI
jgi:hypothetical protein